ncbi:hypothetical protein C4588_01675 [Candidatus Parcubacteria bacterium]|nr:MAG: hypothetical protein C4588_01675 [Candidatus Parcubacteria bacterium]
MSYKVVTNEDLGKALSNSLKKEPLKSQPELSQLLSMIVNRLIETSEKFNSHGHPTQTSFRGDEYESAGDGFADTPAHKGSYGCHYGIAIGREQRDVQK